jgi:large subunit ribosomal protein L4
MTIQKIIEYRPSDSSGENSDEKFRITLNILEDSSNYLIHRDILRHQLSQKQGTVSTKTRSEVRGGGKKPWRQKGTGRARAGSNRSPLWKGGGVIFGPKPKIVTLKVNKKERNLALQTLFYNKRNNMIVVPNLELIEPKTKAFYTFCQNGNINLNEKLLVIVSEKILPIKLATQNLKNVELISASNLNTLSLVKAKKILLTTSALNDIKEIYCERETRH